MALTLVNSGTLTPTVGTASAVDTETPSAPTMYVFEVDTSAMATGDQAMLLIRETASTPKPAGMSVGSATTGSASSSLSMSVSRNAPSGCPILVAAAEGNDPYYPIPCQDSVGNVYTRIGGVTYGSGSNGGGGSLYVCLNPLPLFSGEDWLSSSSLIIGSSTITVFPGLSGASASVLACVLSGLAWVPTPYATGTGEATGGTSLSLSTAASVNAGDLAIAMFEYFSAGSVTFIPPAGWMTIGSANFGGTSGPNIVVCATVPSATGAITATATLGSSSSGWSGIITAFPAASGGAIIAQHFVTPGAPPTFKQSHPILINAGSSVEFDIFQSAGTARAFPWRVWRL